MNYQTENCEHQCSWVKNGRHKTTNRQKLRCKICGRSSTFRYKNKFAKAEIRKKVTRLLDAKHSIRSIAKQLQVSPTSVWTLKKEREIAYQKLIQAPYSIPKKVLHVVQWSGGKDSSALLIWALENLPHDRLKVVFCDTAWESPITYRFIQDINSRLLDNQLIILKSKQYDGLLDLSAHKKRFPSTKARFCTEKLKIYPFIEWLLEQKEDIAVYQGIRAAESMTRSKMKAKDDYLKLYEEYRESPYYHVWQTDELKKKRRNQPILYHQVCTWMDDFDCSVERPLFHWKTDDILEVCRKHDVLNPLYDMGFSRVGCFPCIMERKDGIKKLAEQFPERIETIAQAEQSLDSTFFGYSKVPDSQCLKPNIHDVVKWAKADKQEAKEDITQACMSHFQACE